MEALRRRSRKRKTDTVLILVVLALLGLFLFNRTRQARIDLLLDLGLEESPAYGIRGVSEIAAKRIFDRSRGPRGLYRR